MQVGLFFDLDVRGNDVLLLVVRVLAVDDDGDKPGFESLVGAGGGEAVDAARVGMIGGRVATGQGLGGGTKIGHRCDGGGVRGGEK